MSALAVSLAYLGTLAFAAFWFSRHRQAPRLDIPKEVVELRARLDRAEKDALEDTTAWATRVGDLEREARAFREKLEARDIADVVKGKR